MCIWRINQQVNCTMEDFGREMAFHLECLNEYLYLYICSLGCIIYERNNTACSLVDILLATGILNQEGKIE